MSTNIIASQPIGRLPDPAKTADTMLTAPILPTLVRLSLPNMIAMLAHCILNPDRAEISKVPVCSKPA